MNGAHFNTNRPTPPMSSLTALISVSDKTGIVDFARTLAAQDVRLLSTGGTARLGEKTRQTAEFWLAIAELLDVTLARGAEVATTAARVGLGSAALAKFLTVDPQIVRTINHARAQRGLKALR